MFFYGANRSLRLALWLVSMAFLSLPAWALAFDDDEMHFGIDEVQPVTVETQVKPKLAVVVVPTPELNLEQFMRVNSELRQTMELIHGFQVFSDEHVMPALRERDPMQCSRAPLCLASVGRQANMDRLLVTRITREADGYRLDMDLFDVQERLFLRYHSQSSLGNINQITEAITPAVADVFNIRVVRHDRRVTDDDSSNVQRIFAYSTAILAAAALGTGIYFGMEVSAREKELTAMEKNEFGAYRHLTQREAQQRVRDIEGDAIAANIFFGLSAGLTLTSVLLFVLDSDATSDSQALAPSQEQRRWKVSPAVSTQSVGVGAHWRF